MSKEVLTESVSFINRLVSVRKNNEKTNITFHGGEPLLAGKDFYTYAIPYIKENLNCEANISMQSNLWLFDETLCLLFKQYNVGVGTSLDGSMEINDKQRGSGYFDKTFSKIELLKNQNLFCGCIATFSKPSSEKYEEIFDFFVSNELHFDIHAAIKPINYLSNNGLFLEPDEFGELLMKLLEKYIKNANKIKIGTLDTLIKNVANKQSGLCTFSKCLGEYFAISPTGELYTCNRFVGNKDFCIGNIKDIHSFSDIKQSKAWNKIQAWNDWIAKECKDCLFKDYCNGGCPYSAFASSTDSFAKDPLCNAYKMIYNYIIDKGTAEFFSDTNLEQIKQEQNKPSEISFKETPVLYLMKDKPHPFDAEQISKKIITAALFGKTNNSTQTTEKLYELGIINSIAEKFPLIEWFHNELLQPIKGFNNLYLQLTGICNLSCSHCYSFDDNEIRITHLSKEILLKSIIEASVLAFKKIIFTGGEPLLYPDFEMLLNELIALRNKQKLPLLVLRTNLSTSINPILIEKISCAFDKIIVSVDGSEEWHDKQRGKGAYSKTMNNLALFNKRTIEEKVSFASVLNLQNLFYDELEKEKRFLNSLKSEFSIKELRYQPLLPLGRAKHFKTQRIESENISVIEWIKRKYYLRTSCGLGQNLSIYPNGDTFACHVLKDIENKSYGNVLKDNLHDIVQNPQFVQLRNFNINTNQKCSQCDMRFLCGGVCKIWENHDCSDLYKRAKYLLVDALKLCDVSIDNFD